MHRGKIFWIKFGQTKTETENKLPSEYAVTSPQPAF